MRWLVHGTLSTAATAALERHGHSTHTPDGLRPDASHDEILGTAHKRQLDVLTDDARLPEALFQTPQKFDRSIVYLQLSGGEVEQDDAIDRLFARYKRLSPGRLYTVTESRVKVRQLPGTR